MPRGVCLISHRQSLLFEALALLRQLVELVDLRFESVVRLNICAAEKMFQFADYRVLLADNFLHSLNLLVVDALRHNDARRRVRSDRRLVSLLRQNFEKLVSQLLILLFALRCDLPHHDESRCDFFFCRVLHQCRRRCSSWGHHSWRFRHRLSLGN